MITIFTPSFADEADTNAQNLSVKEDRCPFGFQRVFRGHASRRGRGCAHCGATEHAVIPWSSMEIHCGLYEKFLAAFLILFFPREGPLDAAFLTFRRRLRLKGRRWSATLCREGLRLRRIHPLECVTSRRLIRFYVNKRISGCAIA